MEIGIIGLGRMGGNMAERLRRGGHTIVGYDQAAPTRDVDSLEALVAALAAPARRVGHGPGRWPDRRHDQQAG